EKLSAAVKEIVAGREVVVPCYADGNRDQLHLCKGKLQRLKASLKRIDYDPKRDFVGLGAGAGDDETFDRIVILPASSEGWKYLPAKQLSSVGDRWRVPRFSDRSCRVGKAQVGFVEDAIR